MRIDFNSGTQPLDESRLASGQSRSASMTSSAEAELGQDQASLSTAHTQVQSLVAQAMHLPEVRQERVQALRQAVSSGRYRAEAKQTAGSLFQNLAVARTSA